MRKKLKIVADENMPAVEAMFSDVADVYRCPGRTMHAAELTDADILLVRSVTQVNEALLSQAKSLKMVGTATIGVDHIDQDYLKSMDIPFYSAPGCNANSVVDYVLTALFSLLEAECRDIRDLTVGVIGVGNVGGRLVDRLCAIGVKTLQNDPPKQVSGTQGLVSLETVIQQADIVCLHTPLVKTGEWPTYHLLGELELMGLKENAILLNAGRGPVIDNQALLKIKQQRADLKVVLDVWEHEPRVDKALADYVDIATPHIAGYSLEGKLRGTYMLRECLAEQFSQALPHAFERYLPAPVIQKMTVSEDVSPYELMRSVYDIFRDDRAMRKTLGVAHQNVLFDQLRKQYPVRREFSSLEVSLPSGSEVAHYLERIGFKVS